MSYVNNRTISKSKKLWISTLKSRKPYETKLNFTLSPKMLLNFEFLELRRTHTKSTLCKKWTCKHFKDFTNASTINKFDILRLSHIKNLRHGNQMSRSARTNNVRRGITEVDLL